MYAARNLRLCTKDCVCLFVCPTKATDTENGQIDFAKCLDGCRLCVDACPSHALYLVPRNYSEPAAKDERVAKALFALLEQKALEERAIHRTRTETSNSESGGATHELVLKALEKSLRIVAEDAAREAAYMLPQSAAVLHLIDEILSGGHAGFAGEFPEKELRELKELLSHI